MMTRDEAEQAIARMRKVLPKARAGQIQSFSGNQAYVVLAGLRMTYHPRFEGLYDVIPERYTVQLLARRAGPTPGRAKASMRRALLAALAALDNE